MSVVLVDLSGQVVRSIRKTCPFSLDDGYAQGLGELALRRFTSILLAGPAVIGYSSFPYMLFYKALIFMIADKPIVLHFVPCV